LLSNEGRIDQLKKQAKDLLAELRAGSTEAIERFSASHPRWVKLKGQSKPLLADAQLVIAREYGFPSWAKLHSRVEAIDLKDPVTAFVEAACVPLDGSSHASGTLDAAEAILRANPEVAESDIYVASILGNDVVVKRFLGQGAEDPTATGGLYDWDALTYLCFSRYLRLDRARADGFLRTARLLLEHGASANTGFYSHDHEPDPAFETAIYGAAGIAHHAGLTRLLLAHGADPNDGETPYHVPEGYDNAALEALVESGKVDRSGITTMLHRKHDWHDFKGIEWLLAHGADPNHMSAWGRRALHQALERNHPIRFFELLLDRGADPTLPAKNGRSAVVVAARIGRGDVLDLFARRSVSVALEGEDGLLAACAQADESCARAIVKRSPGMVASIESEDPAVVADVASTGNTAAVRLMLDLGFSAASRTCRAGAPNDTALHAAVWRSYHATAKLLVERGAPLEVTNGRGETPLGYAVRALVQSEWPAPRSAEIVVMLLDAGARVESVTLFPSGFEEVDELLRGHGKV
jgi:ankyrin repeat protein